MTPVCRSCLTRRLTTFCRGDGARGTVVNAARKGNDTHGVNFRANRSRADRARGFCSISLELAN
jgi:hypothetical protein